MLEKGKKSDLKENTLLALRRIVGDFLVEDGEVIHKDGTGHLVVITLLKWLSERVSLLLHLFSDPVHTSRPDGQTLETSVTQTLSLGNTKP